MFFHRALSTALEKDGARILRAVQKRVDTRAQLLSKSTGPHDVAAARQIKALEPLHDAWTSYLATKQALADTLPLLHDPDPTMRTLATDEYGALTARLSTTLTSFSALLVPPSETRTYGALLELKPGVGGSEAGLFQADLMRVYMRYVQAQGWRGEVREGVLEVRGEGVYDVMRWETGVHRVQRVPVTEASGRVHTSTVAVIVLPLSEEAEPVGDDALFKMADVRVEVMRSRGAGGQHVNKTESAVRLTHVPTGVTVSMQDERSQHQNKRRAFQVLRARLLDIKITREVAERRAARQSLVRTADRSEKIRTYNYAQDRVTDHRIGLSLMNLQSFMEGDGLQPFLDAMRRNWEEEMMEDAVSDID